MKNTHGILSVILLQRCTFPLHFIPKANMQRKYYKLPPELNTNRDGPWGTRRKLKLPEKVPLHHARTTKAGKPRKMPKRMADIRGPEETHINLIHRQFGIQAEEGAQLTFGHFNAITKMINHHLDVNRMFAIWRIDPPWKPITKRPQGSRKGGGKGPIHHYATPVKAKRILIEVGGDCDFEEVEPFLKIVSHIMPMKARPVSQEILDKDRAEEQYIEENNINPFTFEWCAKNNIMGCQIFLSPYDWKWFGKYR